MATRLLFVEPPKRYWFVMGDYLPPPTALLVLAAYVERELPDVELRVLDCQGRGAGWEAIGREVASYRPDIVLASGYTCNAYTCARAVELAKQAHPETLTVLGGQHFSFMATESLEAFPELDVVVRGEGEATLVDLVRAVRDRRPLSEVRGISFRHDGRVVSTPDRPLIEDLDSLPMPAYHLVEEHIRRYHFTMMAGRRATYLVMEGGRGCDHRCSFCTQWAHWRGCWRTKSPRRIADEVEHLHAKFGGTFVWLSDDNFDYGRRGRALHDELRRRDSRNDVMLFWQARTDDVAANPDLVSKLRDVGNRWVLMGVESHSQERMDELGKAVEVDEAERAVRILEEADVFTQAMYVIGCRGDTRESIEALRHYSQWLGSRLTIFTVLTPFPGTRVYEEARGAGWIEDRNWANYDMVHAIMPTGTLTRGEVQEELYECYRSMYGSLARGIRGIFSHNALERQMYRHLASQRVLRQLRELV